MLGPVLFTPRLMLRPPEGGDFDAFARFCGDAESMRFLGGAKTRSEAWRLFACYAGAWMVRGYSYFAVVERDTGQWVGRVGPWLPEGWPDPEIAWGIAREYTGRGYAHEAACAAMDYAVDVLGWTRIIHTIDPDNHGSIALAKRLGSTNSGPVTLPPPLEAYRVDAWGQDATDWRARRRA